MRNLTKRSAAAPLRLGLFFVTIAAVVALFEGLLSDSLITWEVIQVAAVGLLLLVAVFLALAWTPPSGDPSRACIRSALIIWVFLLVSEELFSRTGGNVESALQAKFSASAYGEFSLWILAFLLLLALFLKSPRYLYYIRAGQYKWPFLFVVLCGISTIYSPQPLFSMAWAFKLCLVTLVLALCSGLIREEGDLLAFVRATFWACSFLIVVAIYKALADPSTGFENGRLGQSPTSLSVLAGILWALSITLKPLSISFSPAILTIIAPVVMVLGGGKAGIVGGVLSATLIFLLRKKVGSAVALLCGMVGLGVVLPFISAPLDSYFHTYAESGLANNLTGRTGIWAAALPAIQRKLVLGHGYMASKFVSVEIGTKGFGLWEADHMHNAFLDVLYNNGVIGLTLLLIMHSMIIKNLLQVIKYRGAPRIVHGIAVGCLAIYANLLINAFFNAIIGGRPSSLFMLFLALFVLSGSLQKVLLLSSAIPAKPTRDNALRNQTSPVFGEA